MTEIPNNHEIMEPEPPCARCTDLGAYLLHGLSDADANELRRHIDGCVHCTAELRSLRPVADLLAVADFAALPSGPDDVPDPALLTRVLDRVAFETSPTPASARPESGPNPPVALPSVQEAPVLESPVAAAVPITQARRRLQRRALVLAAGAFALGSASTLGVQQVAQNDAPAPLYPGADRIVFADMPSVDAIAWVQTGDAGTYAWLSTKGLQEGTTYRWWFEQTDGKRVPMGSFVSTSKVPGGRLICPGSTAVPRKLLAFVGATDADGNDVLRAKLPYVHST